MSDLTAGPVPLRALPDPVPPAAAPLRDMAVTGPFDAAALLKLREQVTEALADGPVTALVDISGVTQVTASGLAGMLELLRLARSRGGDVRLYGISLAVADAQEASQLTSVTRIYVRRDQAAQAGAQPASVANPARSKKGPAAALRSISGGKSSTGKSSTGQSSTGKSSTGQSSTGQSSTGGASTQAKRGSATPLSDRAVVGGGDR